MKHDDMLIPVPDTPPLEGDPQRPRVGRLKESRTQFAMHLYRRGQDRSAQRLEFMGHATSYADSSVPPSPFSLAAWPFRHDNTTRRNAAPELCIQHRSCLSYCRVVVIESLFRLLDLQ